MGQSLQGTGQIYKTRMGKSLFPSTGISLQTGTLAACLPARAWLGCSPARPGPEGACGLPAYGVGRGAGRQERPAS